MDITRRSTLVLLLFGWSGPAELAAQAVTVDCDAGATIGKALVGAKPGDTLAVRGTCRENVRFGAEVARLTLDGGGKATILGVDAGQAPVTILGREIRVTGFTISGGRNGFNVLRGGTAVIEGNVIEKTGAGGQPGSGTGINVAQHSFAWILGNTIRDNPAGGIIVHESGAVRIGVGDVANALQPNVIERNGGHAISVERSSSARIVGNTIRDNKGDGVRIVGVSHAVVAGNTISGNSGHGVYVTQNSGVDLGGGADLFTDANQTAPTHKNGGAGLKCAVGGYAEGQLASLTGAQGVKVFEPSCTDATTP